MFNPMIRKSFNVFSMFGVGLVDETENRRAQLAGSIVSFVYIVTSLVLLLQWDWVNRGQLSSIYCLWCDWLVWLILFFSFASMVYWVDNTKVFLLKNWLVPIILVAGVLLLAESADWAGQLGKFRPVLAAMIFLASLRFLLQFFLDGRLWTTLAAALAVASFFGLLVAGFDPGVRTPVDGLWWALVTVTTVGYGDVVPVSLLGRVFGVMLLFVGLGVFVVITANFLSLVLRNEERDAANKDYLRAELDKIDANQKAMQKTLKKLQSQLEKLR